MILQTQWLCLSLRNVGLGYNHSARKASNGSNLAAFMAGATPAAMPISNETIKAALLLKQVKLIH